jgi:hypothetical protein
MKILEIIIGNTYCQTDFVVHGNHFCSGILIYGFEKWVGFGFVIDDIEPFGNSGIVVRHFVDSFFIPILLYVLRTIGRVHVEIVTNALTIL